MSTHTHTPRHDHGFTLPEVLISVIVIGIIATVIGSVFTVVLRTTPTTEARADDARSMLGLVTWLPQDVDSTPENGFVLDKVGHAKCDTNPGTNLLSMNWSEEINGTTTQYYSSYRHVSVGSGYRLQRVTCSGTDSSPTFGPSNVINLTSEVPNLPSGWMPGNAPFKITKSLATPSIYSFEITTLNGETVRTDSASKNPAATLAPAQPPSWRPATPVTAVFSNTAPETVDKVLTAHPDVTVGVDLWVSDFDNQPLIVELDTFPTGWSAVLVGLRLTLVPSGVPPTTETVTYTVDDQNGGVIGGKVTVELVPLTTPTTVAATTTTTVAPTTVPPTTIPACVVTGRSLSQSTVKNVAQDSHGNGGGNTTVGVLLDQVTVTATTNGLCTGIDILYTATGNNAPSSVAMRQQSATSFFVPIPGRDQNSSETWEDGTHSISFIANNGNNWGKIDLKVT